MNSTDAHNDSFFTWTLDTGEWDLALALMAHPKFKDFRHINTPNNNGQTPLSIAAANKNTPLPVIHALVKAGSNIHHINKPTDSSVLTLAFKNSRFDIAHCLVMKGAVVTCDQALLLRKKELEKSQEKRDSIELFRI